MRKRIESLVIPPAWTDVWICADPDGHLQATGRDDRGRKQYRYHPRFREAQDHAKFSRLCMFGVSLPRIRARVERAFGSARIEGSHQGRTRFEVTGKDLDPFALWPMAR